MDLNGWRMDWNLSSRQGLTLTQSRSRICGHAQTKVAGLAIETSSPKPMPISRH
jgi:hypothetical protein